MRNLLNLFTILGLSVTLTACQKPLSSWDNAVEQPLPYRFHITSILDNREKKQPHENFNVFPFDRFLLSNEMSRELPYSTFSSYPAKMMIEVTDFATTAYADSYTLSYALNIHAEDDYERTIADKQKYICSESYYSSFRAHKLLSSVYKGESLSDETQHANIFKDLLKKCVKKTIAEFKGNLYNAVGK